MCSGRLEIVVEEIDVQRGSGLGVCSPELGAGEPYAVDVLRLLTRTVRVGVGKDARGVDEMDRAALAAHVARQPGMPRRLHVAGPHRLADREARRALDGAD